MTKPEFTGQFERLCAGFRYESTAEQADAWFRRVGHIGLTVWAESVTNLLCADRFPRDLDRVLVVVELQAQASRAKTVQRDKSTAARVHAALERGAGLPGMAAVPFEIVKAFAGREQVQKYQARVLANDDGDPTRRRLELARLHTEEARLNEIIRHGMPSLSNEDGQCLMERYEPVTA